MRPLRNAREFSSESERRIAELLATLDPYKPSPVRKPSLSVKLAASHQRTGLWLLRPVAALALLFAGTAAAATLGERFWSEPAEEAPPEIPVARSTAPHSGRSKPASAPPATPPEPSPEDKTPADVSKATLPASVTPQRSANAKKPLTRAGEDPRPVVEALRALRKERDPTRAQSLLNDYMRANPQGALSEEALALSIEAARARKDPAAKSYARRYLARYPGGRHRRLAERALAD